MEEARPQRRFNYMGSVTAFSLILTGIIVYMQPDWGKPGLFFISVGAISQLILVMNYLGFFRHRVFQRINNLLKDREDAALDPVSKLGVLIYLSALAYIFIFYNLRINPDQILFLGIFAAALMGKTRKFLSDWMPFVVLIFAYDSMRGIADNIGFPVNYTPLIDAEKLLFLGTLPTVALQDMFYKAGVTQWHDILAVNIYFLHFTPAVLFAAFLWVRKDTLFREFRDSMILVSYAALVTFLLLPAAPPWLAHEEGLIDNLHRIRVEIDSGYIPSTIITIYFLATSNPVAAIPSLHAAYPWLLFIFAVRYWNKRGILLITLPLAVGLSAVYLGEHYVVDILIGYIYASIAYLIIDNKIIDRFIHKHTPSKRLLLSP